MLRRTSMLPNPSLVGVFSIPGPLRSSHRNIKSILSDEIEEFAAGIDHDCPRRYYCSVGDRGSLPSLPLVRKGLADATITSEGAGAGAPERSVASNIWSSLPAIGAGPTNS